jgi:hypothetical protein
MPSRSPSPRRGGGNSGWSSPGLATNSRRSSTYLNGSNASSNITWSSISPIDPERGFPRFSPKSQSQFGKLWQTVSTSANALGFRRNTKDKWSLRSKWSASVPEWKRGDRIIPFILRVLWKLRLLFLALILFIFGMLSLSKRKMPDRRHDEY